MRQDPILTEFRKALFAIAAQQPGGHLARSLNRCFFRQQPRVGIFLVIVAQYPVYASGGKMTVFEAGYALQAELTLLGHNYPSWDGQLLA